jgi:hypothetical protein
MAFNVACLHVQEFMGYQIQVPSQIIIQSKSRLMCEPEAGMVSMICDELRSPEIPEEDQEDDKSRRRSRG